MAAPLVGFAARIAMKKLLNKTKDNKHLLKYYSQTGREKQFDKLFDKNQSLLNKIKDMKNKK